MFQIDPTIAGGLAAGLLLLFIIACCCCRRRRKQVIIVKNQAQPSASNINVTVVAPQPVQMPPQGLQTKYCNNCGAIIKAGSKFCDACGQPQ